MKIVHLNTTINNSSAPYKLHLEMKKQGFESKILTFKADVENSEDVVIVKGSLPYKIKRRIYAKKRSDLSNSFELQEKMPIDILPVGMDLSKHPLVKAADAVFIHWTNGDFFSYEHLHKLTELNIKIYQFCHDNYTFTGGCHVRMGCEGYKSGCSNCPQIKGKDAKEYLNTIVEAKKAAYSKGDITIVSPSTWMDGNVSSSYVLGGLKHMVLPNVIDTEVFKPYEDTEKYRKELGLAADDFVILCAIKADESIPYNGMQYLWSTLVKINKSCSNITIVTFGSEKVSNENIPVINAGYIRGNEKLAMLYSMADVMLVTSLEDSFNQTVAECMSCGTPVVAFDNGGIADIIDHKKNGYLAAYRDEDDLINGLMYIMDVQNNIKDFENPREKIVNSFSTLDFSFLKND